MDKFKSPDGRYFEDQAQLDIYLTKVYHPVRVTMNQLGERHPEIAADRTQNSYFQHSAQTVENVHAVLSYIIRSITEDGEIKAVDIGRRTWPCLFDALKRMRFIDKKGRELPRPVANYSDPSEITKMRVINPPKPIKPATLVKEIPTTPPSPQFFCLFVKTKE